MEKENSKIWAQVVAKAWSDEAFKRRLVKEPEKVLKENGFVLDPNINYHIIEDSKENKSLVIPKDSSK
ncbi:MAG: NHLP leader peptide family natural product precursor [Chlamydiae bacterium]|nr:NHLP leader peptide family natural product precursor [Chlamydiota bacterium]